MTLCMIYPTMVFPYLPPPPTRFQNRHLIRYCLPLKMETKDTGLPTFEYKIPSKFHIHLIAIRLS